MLWPGFEAWRAGGVGGLLLRRRGRRLTISVFRVLGLSHTSGDVRVGHVGILAVRRTVYHRAMMRWVYSR